MLKNVHLKNLALIDEADIDFTSGLNIMTGETGSGKSIIISSVNIALGEKANKSMIRTGAPFGMAELFFTSEDDKVFALLDELGIERDGKNILISRKITPDSSVAKINGENVTLTNLKKVTSLLIDVHGQHDHQSLLDTSNHVRILDEFGKEKTVPVKKALSDMLSSYRSFRDEYKKYDMDQDSLEKEVSLLEYEISEIEAAGLKEGEDEELEKSFKEMSLARRTLENLSRIKYIFTDETSGIVQSFSEALKEIEEAYREDPSLLPFKDTLHDADSIIKDFSRDISRYIDEKGFDQEKYKTVVSRLDLINDLKSRYGRTIEEILDHREKCEKRLDDFKNYEEKRAYLSEELKSLKTKINSLAKELSEARKETAALLDELVIENLKELNFLDCRFKTDFTLASRITGDGFDKVQFMISLNPGQPLKPLSSVASGGELSRIMLAIKSALAEKDHIETLIFDEIDTGISGKTASMVAEKLKELSKGHQLICITHLPQIASKADSHFIIEKEVNEGSVISGVRLLDEAGSVEELAKMMSAGEVTRAALVHAKELKK